jgi:hypothetical protein
VHIPTVDFLRHVLSDEAANPGRVLYYPDAVDGKRTRIIDMYATHGRKHQISGFNDEWLWDITAY